MSISDLEREGFYGPDAGSLSNTEMGYGSSMSMARDSLLPPDTFTGTNLRFKDPDYWKTDDSI